MARSAFATEVVTQLRTARAAWRRAVDAEKAEEAEEAAWRLADLRDLVRRSGSGVAELGDDYRTVG